MKEAEAEIDTEERSSRVSFHSHKTHTTMVLRSFICLLAHRDAQIGICAVFQYSKKSKSVIEPATFVSSPGGNFQIRTSRKR